MTAPSGGTTTDAARYLRDTAKLMRELAKAATAGPWEPGTDGHGDVLTSWEHEDMPGGDEHNRGKLVVAERAGPDSEHIASWDPTVARAVADLLDKAATVHEFCDARNYGEPKGDVLVAALAIARAYRRDLP